MRFEWDEARNEANIKKHGFGFERAKKIFENPVLTWRDDRFDYGEDRYIGLGEMEEILIVAVVYTKRKEFIRIISARTANKKEREKYHAFKTENR